MARKTKSKDLGDRTARSRLEVRSKPHWHTLTTKTLALGYRRLGTGKDGSWIGRQYMGGQKYELQRLGTADDVSDADGAVVMTCDQAAEAARKWRDKRANGGRVAGKYRISECMEDYFEWREGQGTSLHSLNGDRGRSAAYILPQIGNVECAALTHEQIERWRDKVAAMPGLLRTSKGESQRFKPVDRSADAIRRRKVSANKVFSILKAALNLGWRRKKIALDDEWRRVQSFENVARARDRYLKVDEAKRLMNALDPEYRDIVHVLFISALRFGDASRLRVQDYNPDSGTLAVRQSKTQRVANVVLAAEGIELFERLVAGRKPDDLILTNRNGEQFGRSVLNSPMREAAKRAKISPKGIGPHVCRHTYASLALMNGAPMPVIAQNLGHTSTRMVERTYGHLADSYTAKVIRESAPKFGIKIDNKVVGIK